MRLPLTKVYRAFPELDEFSDDRCAAFMATSLAQAPMPLRAAMFVAIGGMFFPLSCFGGVFMVWVCDTVVRDISETPWHMTAALLLMSFGVGVPLVASFLLRDWWRRRLLRRQLISLSCPGCSYSLLGLRPVDGAVVCPECGASHTLAKLGMAGHALEELHRPNDQAALH